MSLGNSMHSNNSFGLGMGKFASPCLCPKRPISAQNPDLRSSWMSRMCFLAYARTCPSMRYIKKTLVFARPSSTSAMKKQRFEISHNSHRFSNHLRAGPAAHRILLAAAARAGGFRLGLLPHCRLGQCQARIVAEDLVDTPQGLGCSGVSLCCWQCEEPPGLVEVLGEADSFCIKYLKGCVCLDVVDRSLCATSNKLH